MTIRIIHTPASTLTAISDANSGGDYSCDVTFEGQTIRTGNLPVFVTGAPPRLLDMEPASLSVNEPFELQIPFDTDPFRHPDTFSVTGLPPGMSFDAGTGFITGAPTWQGTYRVSAVAANRYGRSNRMTVSFQVEGPLKDLAGEWMALVDPSNELADFDLGGRLDFKVSPAGKVSGVLRLGPDTYPWRSKLSELNAGGAAVLDLSISRGQAKSAVQLRLELGSDFVSGRPINYTSNLVLGWRKVWTERGPNPRLASAYAGYHVFRLPAFPRLDPLYARTTTTGSGFGSLRVGSDGSVRIIGRTGDGQPLVFSAQLGPAGELGIFATSYGGRGALCGTALMAADEDHTISRSTAGNVVIFWNKRPHPRDVRHYPDGFSSWVIMEGGKYTRPDDWSELLGGSGGIDATAEVRGDGFGRNGIANLPLRVNPRSVTAPTTELPRFGQFRLNPATGLFNGTILREENGRRLQLPIAGVMAHGIAGGYVRLPARQIVYPEPTVVYGSLEILPNAED